MSIRDVDANGVDANAVDVNSDYLNTVDANGTEGDALCNMSQYTPEQKLRTRLAQNLRKLRASQGISQEALADKAGLHRTFVSQVERELRALSLDNVAKLANALNVDPVELFRPE